MKIGHILAGGMLLAVAALAAYEVHHDRARVDAMRKEMAQLREDVSSSRGNGDRVEPLRMLLSAAQAAPAQPAPAPAPAPVHEAAAPQAEARPKVTSAQMREHMDGTFGAEHVDGTWAGTAQHLAQERLRGAMPEGSEVRSVECRASLCRIETSHVDGEHFQEFVRKAFVTPETHLWNGGTFSTRLEDASQTEGRFVVVSYLAKDGQGIPPIE